MKRVSSRIFAGLAALALAGGGITAAATAGNAATSDCASCINLASQQFPGDVAEVSGGTAQAGQKVILSAAGPFAAEDFTQLLQGSVQDFFNAGIIGPAVGQTWPNNPVYEFQYTPAGTESGLCLGTPATAANGVAVDLQPCGVNAQTTWIPLAIDDIGGFEPLINGTDTEVNTPFVLSAGSSAASKLTTHKLDLIAGPSTPRRCGGSRPACVWPRPRCGVGARASPQGTEPAMRMTRTFGFRTEHDTIRAPAPGDGITVCGRIPSPLYPT